MRRKAAFIILAALGAGALLGACRPAEPVIVTQEVRVVETEPISAQQRACGMRFLEALRREVDVDPAGEAVLPVPYRLAVAQENEPHRRFRHRTGL